jgi:hypothetical protein
MQWEMSCHMLTHFLDMHHVALFSTCAYHVM